MNIKYQHPTLLDTLPYYKVMDDLSKGVVGIEANKLDYLPLEMDEDTQSYDSRFNRATYLDNFNPIVNGIAGLIFKNPVTFNEDIPKQIENLLFDIDLQGNSANNFIFDFFKVALLKGQSFCLIDMPNIDKSSKADEIKNNIRPYLTLIQPENITAWKFDNINGRNVLTMVKILEHIEIDDPDNIFATKTIEQYRILEIGTYKIVQVDNENETIISEGFTNLDFIPLVNLNLNKKGFFQTLPPFYDLAKLNIAHFQVMSDIRYSAHLASVPMLLFLGFDKDEIAKMKISVNTALASHNTDASVDYISYDGKSLEVNHKILDRIETKMREMGLSVITTNKATTATEINISSNQSQSKINSYVGALKDAFDNILLYMAKFYGLDDGGSININADIVSQPLDSQDLIALNNIVSAGNMSLEQFYKIIKSGTLKLSDDFDIDVELEKIKSDGLLSINE